MSKLVANTDAHSTLHRPLCWNGFRSLSLSLPCVALGLSASPLSLFQDDSLWSCSYSQRRLDQDGLADAAQREEQGLKTDREGPWVPKVSLRFAHHFTAVWSHTPEESCGGGIRRLPRPLTWSVPYLPRLRFRRERKASRQDLSSFLKNRVKDI